MDKGGRPSRRELREWDLEDEIDAWYLTEAQRIYEEQSLNDNFLQQISNLRNAYRAKIAQINHRLNIEFWDDN